MGVEENHPQRPETQIVNELFETIRKWLNEAVKAGLDKDAVAVDVKLKILPMLEENVIKAYFDSYTRSGNEQ